MHVHVSIDEQLISRCAGAHATHSILKTVLTTLKVDAGNKWTGTLSHTNTLVEEVTAHLSGSPRRIAALETSGTVGASYIK